MYKAMYKGQPLGGGSSAPAGSNIPSGGIIMWSGSEAPEGWALCDGQNGTPDLRGRFVLGSSPSHTIASKGGYEKVTLLANEMPQHNHSNATINISVGANMDFVTASAIPTSTKKLGLVQNGSTSTSFPSTSTVPSQETQPHENMPPYYTLAYIMKL